MASCTTLDASLLHFGQIPKTAVTMPDLLSRKDGVAKRMPILINHERSLLSRSASSRTTASGYWPRLNLVLMTFRATLRLFSSPQRTASALSTSMNLLKASVTLDHALRQQGLEHCNDHNCPRPPADSPAFSARKSSGHRYATEGHGLGTPLAHPVFQPEHSAGSCSRGALHTPHTTMRIASCSCVHACPRPTKCGRPLGSEMAVRADERARDFALPTPGRNDPPHTTTTLWFSFLDDPLQPDLLPLVYLFVHVNR